MIFVSLFLDNLSNYKPVSFSIPSMSVSKLVERSKYTSPVSWSKYGEIFLSKLKDRSNVEILVMLCWTKESKPLIVAICFPFMRIYIPPLDS